MYRIDRNAWRTHIIWYVQQYMSNTQHKQHTHTFVRIHTFLFICSSLVFPFFYSNIYFCGVIYNTHAHLHTNTHIEGEKNRKKEHWSHSLPTTKAIIVQFHCVLVRCTSRSISSPSLFIPFIHIIYIYIYYWHCGVILGN